MPVEDRDYVPQSVTCKFGFRKAKGQVKYPYKSDQVKFKLYRPWTVGMLSFILQMLYLSRTPPCVEYTSYILHPYIPLIMQHDAVASTMKYFSCGW